MNRTALPDKMGSVCFAGADNISPPMVMRKMSNARSIDIILPSLKEIGKLLVLPVPFHTISSECSNPWIAQYQFANICLAHVSSNFNLLTLLAVDLHDQCEGFLVHQCFIINGPLTCVDTAKRTGFLNPLLLP